MKKPHTGAYILRSYRLLAIEDCDWGIIMDILLS